MSKPVHINVAIASLFGGFPPYPDTLAMTRQFRSQYLPEVGICQVRATYIPGYGNIVEEGTMAMEVFQAICYQINQRFVDPEAICEVCPRWDCPIQKGTVLFRLKS